MKNALNWLLMFAEPKRVYSKTPWVTKKGEIRHNFTFRLAFITLTLSAAQNHSDKHIKDHMLQPFLYFITRYYKANYVWKAETQLNGNIHFHITIDTFIHWKVIRKKWNQILARHNYCRTFQDGSNDKGDSATQIKSIKNENGLAKCIGGYLTKNSIEEKYHSELIKKRTVKIEELLKNSSGVTCNIEKKMHYTRFVEGRLWGCSEALSKIKCFTDELDSYYSLQNIEHEFFHKNKLRRLSDIMIEKELKHSPQANIEHLRDKYRSFRNVFTHKHLRWCHQPPILQQKIADTKSNYKRNSQTFFTVESLN